MPELPDIEGFRRALALENTLAQGRVDLVERATLPQL